MPEIVRRLPEILRRCYHEEVVESCRRKSASSSVRPRNFSSRTPGLEPASPRLLYWVLSHCAIWKKAVDDVDMNGESVFYTVRYFNIQWYLVSTLVTADDFSVRFHPPRASKVLKKHIAHEGEV